MLTTDREEARRQVNTHPTEAQCKAENYKMGHLLVNGFDISIENPKGSYRRGKDRNGKEWKTLMHHDYGYFRKTVGKDGDAVDVFLGPNLKSTKVFPIDQYINGQFDETKVMMGFDSKEEAKAAYLSNYDKDWKGFKYITEVDIDTFAKWLYDGHRQRKPFAKYAWLKEDKINIRRILCEETGEELYNEAWENGHDVSSVLWEFLSDKKEGRKQKHWRLIPANQYYNLLNRFMVHGAGANIPYNVVNGWFTQIILFNTMELEYLTELMGHSQYFPFDDFADVFGEEWEHCNDYDKCSDYLGEIGFYDWALLPDGSDAMSDYGLKPLFKIIKEYNSEMSPGEILVLINRILDVAHCRGDLASMFIQGGSHALSQISNKGLVSEGKTGKNTYTIEIEFSGYYNEKKQRFSDAAVPEILDYLKTKKLEDVVVRMDYDKKNEISFDEVDLFCSKIGIKTLEYIPKQERSNFIAKITCDKQTGLSLIKLFMNLGAIGNCGHTFEVLIGKEEFCFDGDGSDRILSINGEKLRGEMLNRPDKWYEILKKGGPEEKIELPEFPEEMLREMIRESIMKKLNKGR